MPALGAGRRPEAILWQRIHNLDRLIELLSTEVPPERKAPAPTWPRHWRTATSGSRACCAPRAGRRSTGRPRAQTPEPTRADSSSERTSGTPSALPKQVVDRPLGVRHQADDVASLIADAGDVVDRAIGVVDVAEDDPVVGLQLGQRLGVTGVVALEVVDRDAERLADRGRGGQHRVRGLDPELRDGAQELQAPVLLQRARAAGRPR